MKIPMPTAIITAGAGPGIGHGITETLSAAGWAVVIVDRDEKTARALAETIGKSRRESGGDSSGCNAK